MSEQAWSTGRMILTGDSRSTRRKPCHRVPLWQHRILHELTSNPGLRSDRSATHCLSHRPLFCAKKGGAGSSQKFVRIYQTTRRHNPQDGETELQISGYTLPWINEDCWRQSRVQLSAGVTNTCLWRHQERDVTSLTFKRRIKSHLPFEGINRSSTYSPRFQVKG